MSKAGWTRLALLLALLALLELLCRAGVIPSFTVIPPSAMAASLAKILASGEYARDIAVTLGNVGIAIAAATLAGVAFGTALHGWPAARRVLEPLFATYYAVPMYAFYPLLIVVFGLGDLPQIAIGFLLAVMAVVINTLNGLDRVPACSPRPLGCIGWDRSPRRCACACPTPRLTSSPASSWRSPTPSSASSAPSSSPRAAASATRSRTPTTTSTTP